MERLEINEDSVVFIADSSPTDTSSPMMSPSGTSSPSSSSGHGLGLGIGIGHGHHGHGHGHGIAMGGSGRRSSGEISSPSSYAAAAAGRKGVIQVGGVDAGLHIVTGSEKSRREKEKEREREREREREGAGELDGGSGACGRTMWLLQITDSEEARKWIAAIKGVVLSQRYVSPLSFLSTFRGSRSAVP